ncbi:MAG: hypothetical protein ACLF0P_09415 [Thermoanaerobaculia bacterium]
MRRATITLSDELEAELEEYLAAQEVPPSLTSLVQAALGSFLSERRSRPERHGGFAGPVPSSEVAERAPSYGTGPATGRSAGPESWGAPAPRLVDLPDLLSGLPRLSETEARELAGDLGRARDEIEALDAPPDPWAEQEPETGGEESPRSGGT